MEDWMLVDMPDDEVVVEKKLRLLRVDDKGTTKLFASKIPESESDFKEYAQSIYHKLLQPYEEKISHYISLMKHVMGMSVTGLKAVDIKEVTRSALFVTFEKLKAEYDGVAAVPPLRGPINDVEDQEKGEVVQVQVKAKKGDGNTVETFIPESRRDFHEYARRICDELLLPNEKSLHYISLLKHLMGLSVTGLELKCAQEVLYFVHFIAYEKFIEEKEPPGGKKNIVDGVVMNMRYDDIDVTDGCNGYSEIK